MTKEKQIYIFDTTLRDGEQTPGVVISKDEKLKIALRLAGMGVNIIEAGFPNASFGDFESVKLIADLVGDTCQVAALSRCKQVDVDRAWESIKGAKNPRLHLFLATSDIHLKHKLSMSREGMLLKATTVVKYARTLTSNIEFSAEDATRSDLDFVCRVFEAVIEAGATTVNYPDTTGYAYPDEFGKQVAYIIKNVSNIDKAVLSVHCHNDLGMAVANSLAAVGNGARQVECTVNGLGERAGNAAMDEVVMAMKTRADLFSGYYTSINTKGFVGVSRLVSSVVGINIPPNKAIVGRNAFAHQSGVHQDGVLKERTTYEIMEPTEVGHHTNNIVLGKLSGRHAVSDKVLAMGYTLSVKELDRVFTRFKELADQRAEVPDEDLEAIVLDEVLKIPEVYRLVSLSVMSGNQTMPTAAVKLWKGKDEELCGAETSAMGPIDAAYKCIIKLTGIEAELRHFSVQSFSGSTESQGGVTIKVSGKGKVVVAHGLDSDITTAAVKAFVNSLNRLEYFNGKNK